MKIETPTALEIRLVPEDVPEQEYLKRFEGARVVVEGPQTFGQNCYVLSIQRDDPHGSIE